MAREKNGDIGVRTGRLSDGALVPETGDSGRPCGLLRGLSGLQGELLGLEPGSPFLVFDLRELGFLKHVRCPRIVVVPLPAPQERQHRPIVLPMQAISIFVRCGVGRGFVT